MIFLIFSILQFVEGQQTTGAKSNFIPPKFIDHPVVKYILMIR